MDPFRTDPFRDPFAHHSNAAADDPFRTQGPAFATQPPAKKGPSMSMFSRRKYLDEFGTGEQKTVYQDYFVKTSKHKGHPAYQRADRTLYNLHDMWVPEPDDLTIWYPAENNWQPCISDMSRTFMEISEEYTGQSYHMQQMRHGTLGRPGPVMQQEVLDVFADTDFGAELDSWFRPNEDRVNSRLQAPKLWLRTQEFSLDVYPTVDPSGALPRAGRVYQGEVEDFYLVAALQAIGMKPQLIANLFANMDYSNPRLGLYIVRFYKHGQWVPVVIDDQLPFDKQYSPLCITGEFWPDLCWPSLVQKAYAKMHGSWSALGGGGHVEEAMADLTGGCASRFGTQDVAPDRLWQYLFEMQRWCVFACRLNDKETGKRGISVQKIWATSIWQVKKYDGIPYVCVCTSAPTLGVKKLPRCDVPSEERYGMEQGFVWLRIDDFVTLYDLIYECRLVNSDLGSVDRTGIPYSPGWVVGYPWYEEMWAFQGDVFYETAPSFLFDIKDVPSELTLEISQTDLRYDKSRGADRGRHKQAPLLLRFFQCSEGVSDVRGGEIYLVHMSAWGHARDAMCGVKVLKPGKYIAMVTLPVQYECCRMIFRCYSTKPVAMKVVTQHRQWVAVQGSAPLHAIPYSLTGFMRVDNVGETLPLLFDEADGKGASMASPLAGGMPKRGDRRLATKWHNWLEEMQASYDRSDFGGKRLDGEIAAGTFGGPDAHATVEAKEMHGCCAM